MGIGHNRYPTSGKGIINEIQPYFKNSPYGLGLVHNGNIININELREYSIKNKTPVCIEIMVTTFGDWVMNTPEQPNGKIITYHAGPTPSVSLDNHILLKDTSEDPIFTLRKYIDEKTLKEMSKTIKGELLDEIK